MVMRTTPTKKTPRVPAAERRAQFLDVAQELVIERGPEAVTMERVCELSGVNRALIYRFFANRGELLVALVERDEAALDAAVAAGMAEVDTFEDELRAIMNAYIGLSMRKEMIVAQRIGSMSAPPGVLLEWQNKRTLSLVSFLSGWIRSHHPELSGRDALILAASLGSASNGILALAESGEQPDRLIEAFVQIGLGATDRMVEIATQRSTDRRTRKRSAPATKELPRAAKRPAPSRRSPKSP